MTMPTAEGVMGKKYPKVNSMNVRSSPPTANGQRVRPVQMQSYILLVSSNMTMIHIILLQITNNVGYETYILCIYTKTLGRVTL